MPCVLLARNLRTQWMQDWLVIVTRTLDAQFEMQWTLLEFLCPRCLVSWMIP